MWSYEYEMCIDAPINVVFGILQDLEHYSLWNPFLVEAEGQVEVDGIVRGKVALGALKMPFEHKIFAYEPNHCVCWRDFGVTAQLVRGQRSRFVADLAGKTHYRCVLQVAGPLSLMSKMVFGKALCEGIVAEARALKYLAEEGKVETR